MEANKDRGGNQAGEQIHELARTLNVKCAAYSSHDLIVCPCLNRPVCACLSCDGLTACISFSPQNIPTLGTVAITMALHNCDEVAVAGFGYDMNTPHAPLHYYETVKMSAIKEVSACNIRKEDIFHRHLSPSFLSAVSCLQTVTIILLSLPSSAVNLWHALIYLCWEGSAPYVPL